MWFADEARVGQKNKITRRWAKRGTRPSAPQDQRTAFPCIFGAICPKDGKGAGLILPQCNTQAMNLHLAGISGRVAPACHALLLLDQAGRHLSHHLVVPENITLLPLPAQCPEPCVAENAPPDGFLNAPHRSRTSGRSCGTTGLSNRIFTDQGDITEHCCNAWNRLTDSPSRSTSIGMRDWVHGL